MNNKQKYTEEIVREALGKKKVIIDDKKKLILITPKSDKVGIKTLGMIDYFLGVHQEYRMERRLS